MAYALFRLWHLRLRHTPLKQGLPAWNASSPDAKAFPLEFLIEFIQLLGFEPQTLEDPKFFDLSNAAFLKESSGLPNEISGPIVTFLNDMFLMEASDLELYKEALPIILKYMKLHLPSFDNEKSLGIIKDILYT